MGEERWRGWWLEERWRELGEDDGGEDYKAILSAFWSGEEGVL